MGDNKFRFVFAGIFLVTFLFLIAYAMGALVPTPNNGINATSFRAEPNVSTTFSITLNQSLGNLDANFTEINITLPAGFLFVLQSNFSNVPATFRNQTGVNLSWFNAGSFVANATNLTVVNFTATSNSIGTYRIIVWGRNSFNATVFFGQQNLSIVVNDTIPSNITYVSPTNDTETNLTTGITTITVNVTVVDGVSLDSVAFMLQNGSSLALTNTSTFKWVGNVTTSQAVTFLNLSDGVYYVNATVNDTNNNVNVTLTRIFRIDSTKPTASFGCSPITVERGTDTTCSCTGSDATSGVRTTSYTAHPDVSLTGTSLQTQCTVTDNSGNSQTFTTTYNVVSTGGSSGGGSSGGGGASSGTTSWTQTIDKDDSELSQTTSVAQSLGSSQRVALKIGGSAHHVGVKTISGTTSAVIEVSSTPQQATMNVGDEKKFDLDGDNYYDLKVTLKSISAGKANLDMVALHEAIPAGTTTTQTTTPETTGAGETGATTSSSSSWIIWIAVVLVIAIVVVIFLRKRMK